jgi:hypothetical protein
MDWQDRIDVNPKVLQAALHYATEVLQQEHVYPLPV